LHNLAFWSAAADCNRAFAASPVTPVKRMAASGTFLFTVTPFQKRETTVTFEMGDLKEKLIRSQMFAP
jgi:hypothetical protein